MAKRRYNRRDFMGLSGAGIAGLLGAQWPAGQAAAAVDSSQEPDLVVFNAKVYTVDPLEPRAQAFAVKGGRFVAVGSTEDVKALIGKRTQTFDARQMTVVPGFIDAHNHAPGAILLYEVLVGNPYQVEFVTIASIVDKLRAKARETPAGFWVEGFFFDDTKVQDKRALRAVSV
jgi:predicted amidohydrolase YtcJ